MEDKNHHAVYGLAMLLASVIFVHATHFQPTYHLKYKLY